MSDELEVQQFPNLMVDRIANAVVTVVPPILLILAAIFSWGGLLQWSDVAAFVITYLLCGLGITVGFHRLFTHRSFKTHRPTRWLIAVLGSAAVEGPVIEWVATHRKHHQFSDQAGDPHSPHVGHDHGFIGAIKGLFHAHVGWAFGSMEPADPNRYAKDLISEPALRFINNAFLLWVLVGLALPFGLGYAFTGTIEGALTGLLWGGVVRIFVLHHATFSINSLCHFFGPSPYDTGDESRNLAWLAVPTLGESWHNNHHAFPTSARHGLGRFQLDFSAIVIDLMEKVGLAWDVIRISPEKVADKKGATRQEPVATN